MLGSRTAPKPYYRTLEIVCASAILLLVAPLLVVTLIAVRARLFERFLHVSGLADLPVVYEIVRGRA